LPTKLAAYARVGEGRMREDDSGSEVVPGETGEIEADSSLQRRQRVMNGKLVGSATLSESYNNVPNLKIAVDDGEIAQPKGAANVTCTQVWKYQSRKCYRLSSVIRFMPCLDLLRLLINTVDSKWLPGVVVDRAWISLTKNLTVRKGAQRPLLWTLF